jgi:protein TonB
MRYLYTGICGLLSYLAHGQSMTDTLGYEQPQTAEHMTRHIASQTDSMGQCVEILTWGEAGGLMRTYYASGRLKEYVPYANLAAGQVHGLATTWYEDGQLSSMQPYLGGQRDGSLVLYYENGQLKRQTRYEAGAELPGQCFDAKGQPVAYFPYEQLPLYPGGQAQLAKEINKALRWPREVLPLVGQLQPVVGISFLVDKDGSIQCPKVAVSSEVPAIDHAVLATIAKLTRRFTPARRDGQVVQSNYYLPIRFDSIINDVRTSKNLMRPRSQF